MAFRVFLYFILINEVLNFFKIMSILECKWLVFMLYVFYRYMYLYIFGVCRKYSVLVLYLLLRRCYSIEWEYRIREGKNMNY